MGEEGLEVALLVVDGQGAQIYEEARRAAEAAIDEALARRYGGGVMVVPFTAEEVEALELAVPPEGWVS